MRSLRSPIGCIVSLVCIAALTGCGGGSGGSHASINVTTLAGSSVAGYVDGPGAQALFDDPVNVAVDAQGNVYVADYNNGRIRRITPAGIVSTLTSQANFSRPFGLTFDPSGLLYAETDANDQGQRDDTTGTIWQINLTSGAATVVARNLGRPHGLAALPNGQIVLCDPIHDTLSLVTVSTGTVALLAGAQDTTGYVDGLGSGTRFNAPSGITTSPNGNILVADCSNNRIRLVSPTGVVATLAGNGTAGYRDGAGTQAEFNAPQAVTTDLNGNIYVSDNGNHRIRRIDSSGNVSTIAGDGNAGYKDGQNTGTEFYGQQGLAVSSDGTSLYVADGGGDMDAPYNRIRKIVISQ